MPTSTPWGLSKANIKFAPGINWYETPRGSGFHLSLKKHQEMPRFLRKLGSADGWYPSGGPDAAVIIAYREFFPAEKIGRAHQIMNEKYPKEYSLFKKKRVGLVT